MQVTQIGEVTCVRDKKTVNAVLKAVKTLNDNSPGWWARAKSRFDAFGHFQAQSAGTNAVPLPLADFLTAIRRMFAAFPEIEYDIRQSQRTSYGSTYDVLDIPFRVRGSVGWWEGAKTLNLCSPEFKGEVPTCVEAATGLASCGICFQEIAEGEKSVGISINSRACPNFHLTCLEKLAAVARATPVI